MNLLELKQRADDLKRQRSRISVKALSAIAADIEKIDAELKGINSEIETRVNAAVEPSRKAKKTGVVNVSVEGVQIKHNQPKKIIWDQRRLRGVRDKIKAGGDDPDEYVDMKLSVNERNFQAWPESIKKHFKDARTEKPGKPTFEIKIIDDGPGFNMPGK